MHGLLLFLERTTFFRHSLFNDQRSNPRKDRISGLLSVPAQVDVWRTHVLLRIAHSLEAADGGRAMAKDHSGVCVDDVGLGADKIGFFYVSH